jgi:hypothetical protein
MNNSTKKIVIPIDGSETASGSLDYLVTLYSPKYNLEVILMYIPRNRSTLKLSKAVRMQLMIY